MSEGRRWQKRAKPSSSTAETQRKMSNKKKKKTLKITARVWICRNVDVNIKRTSSESLPSGEQEAGERELVRGLLFLI